MGAINQPEAHSFWLLWAGTEEGTGPGVAGGDLTRGGPTRGDDEEYLKVLS